MSAATETATATATATRENAVLWFDTKRPRMLKLPLMTLTCHFCGALVDVTAPGDTFGIARINGDSRYGYEPYHAACISR